MYMGIMKLASISKYMPTLTKYGADKRNVKDLTKLFV